MTSTLRIANEVTKALFPETYGKPGITLEQGCQLIGARGLIEEVLKKHALSWQPIETAPKDGGWVMLKGGEVVMPDWSEPMPPIVIARWYDGSFKVTNHDADSECRGPTGWMPIPDA